MKYCQNSNFNYLYSSISLASLATSWLVSLVVESILQFAQAFLHLPASGDSVTLFPLLVLDRRALGRGHRHCVKLLLSASVEFLQQFFFACKSRRRRKG